MKMLECILGTNCNCQSIIGTYQSECLFALHQFTFGPDDVTGHRLTQFECVAVDENGHHQNGGYLRRGSKGEQTGLASAVLTYRPDGETNEFGDERGAVFGCRNGVTHRDVPIGAHYGEQ